MKRILMIAALATTLVGFAGLASANEFRGSTGSNIDRREWRQDRRIAQGARRGDLTRREEARLRAGQFRVHRVEGRAWRDGRLGPRERMRLARMQNMQSRRIWRLRHNGRCS